MDKNCKKCGADIADGMKFCIKCGTPVSPETDKAKFCMHCGAAIPAGAKFCIRCGSTAGTTGVAAPPIAAPAGGNPQAAPPAAAAPVEIRRNPGRRIGYSPVTAAARSSEM